MGISMASVPLSTKNARSDVSVDELDELVDLRDLDDLDEVGDFLMVVSEAFTKFVLGSVGKRCESCPSSSRTAEVGGSRLSW